MLHVDIFKSQIKVRPDFDPCDVGAEMTDVNKHSAVSGWPVHYRDQLILGNPDSHVAVCTLWAPKERIARQLQQDQFTCVGNLYSREGVNFILRNVMANPSIRYIVLCGKSPNKSDEALLNLMKNGIDTDHRIVGDAGIIDREIPKKAVDLFRQNVTVVDIRPTLSSDTVRSEILKLRRLAPFGKPQTFPEATAHDVDSFPSEKAGFIIRASNIAQAWLEIVHNVMTFGGTQETDYGVRQKELIDLMVVVENTADDSSALPSWIPIRKRDINRYVKSFLLAEKDTAVAYSYGQRLYDFNGINQVKTIIKDLKRFQTSRRAVAVLWDPVRDSASKDPPCVDLVQTSIRDQRVYLTAYIRSNDMYRAWHLNAYALRALQEIICEEFPEATIGPLTTISQSAHIYEDCWKDANALTTELKKKILAPATFIQDPRGSFVIELGDGEIIASLYSTEGTKVAEFRGKSAKEIRLQVVPLISRIDHAMYLGREFHRAEQAMRSGESYVQDKI